MKTLASQGAEKLNKRDFELLGRVFMCEIQGMLPAQIGKSKVIKALEDRGYIKPLMRRFGGPRLPVTVSGWELTEAGRYTYCQNCTRDDLK